MKNTTTIGAVLLIIGFLMLVYQGFSFTKRETVVDLGPIRATADKTETVPIPPIVGWAVTGAGAALLYAGMKRKQA